VHESDLAFYPTQDLVNELMRRKTFLGVIVHSQSEFKQQKWGPERTFKVQFNSNLTSAEASRLLETVADYMDSNPC